MTDEADEYKNFLTSLYNEYIEKKTAQFRYNSFPTWTSLHPPPSSRGASRIQPRAGSSALSSSSPSIPSPSFTPFEIRRELENSLYPIELIRSMHTINLITDCKDDNEMYKTLQRDALGQLVSTLKRNVQVAKVSAQETGHLDAIDDNFEALLDGIRYDYLPPQDAEIFRRLGFCDAETELHATVYRIKTKKGQWTAIIQKEGITKPSEIFNKAEGHLKEKEGSTRSRTKGIASRRWFTGLGGLIKGCGLVIGNIGLLTITSGGSIVGSIPSATAGFAEIFDWYRKAKTVE